MQQTASNSLYPKGAFPSKSNLAEKSYTYPTHQLLITKLLCLGLICCALATHLVGEVTPRTHVESYSAGLQHGTKSALVGTPEHIFVFDQAPDIQTKLSLINPINKLISQYRTTADFCINIYFTRDIAYTLRLPRWGYRSRVRLRLGSVESFDPCDHRDLLRRRISRIEDCDGCNWLLTFRQLFIHLWIFDIKVSTILDFARESRFLQSTSHLLPLMVGEESIDDGRQHKDDLETQRQSNSFAIFWSIVLASMCFISGITFIGAGIWVSSFGLEGYVFSPNIGWRHLAVRFGLGVLILMLGAVLVWHGLEVTFG